MPKPKQQQQQQPPPLPSKNNDTNALAPSISNASSIFSHHSAADLRRETSASSFTPAPSISRPIPPLPQRQHQHQSSREYRDPRRPSASSSLISPTSAKLTSSISDSFHSIAGQSSPTSASLPRAVSSASHVSAKSNSSAGSYSIPHRGSIASMRTNDPLPLLPNQTHSSSPSLRSSMYSVPDDSLTLTRTNKSTADFSLERPTDDSVIEEMFHDLIVS